MLFKIYLLIALNPLKACL